jgi:hypothetical protein
MVRLLNKTAVDIVEGRMSKADGLAALEAARRAGLNLVKRTPEDDKPLKTSLNKHIANARRRVARQRNRN